MTESPARLPQVEVVLSGAVTLESLAPILRCLRQLVTDAGTYVIRAEEVTRIELGAAELLLGFVDEVIQRGSIVDWATASRSLLSTAQAVAIDSRVGLSALAS